LHANSANQLSAGDATKVPDSSARSVSEHGLGVQERQDPPEYILD